MPLRATILTLPCHKVERHPVAARADVRTVFETACQRLSITPEQLRQELEAGGDFPDLVWGALTPNALRLIAKTLALMRDPYTPEPHVISTTVHGAECGWNLRTRMHAERVGEQIIIRTLSRYYLTYYGFGHIHKSLSVAPAIETGITDHARSLKETAVLAN
jgi:hypothetical protein